MYSDPVLAGRSITTPDSGNVHLLPRNGDRHGLVMLAESFSRAGVPVFMAAIKGDVAGLAVPGTLNGALQKQVDLTDIDGFTVEGSPNRESAEEILARRAQEIPEQAECRTQRMQSGPKAPVALGQLARDARLGTGRRQGMIEPMGKQAARSVGNQISRQVMRA